MLVDPKVFPRKLTNPRNRGIPITEPAAEIQIPSFAVSLPACALP